MKAFLLNVFNITEALANNARLKRPQRTQIKFELKEKVQEE